MNTPDGVCYNCLHSRAEHTTVFPYPCAIDRPDCGCKAFVDRDMVTILRNLAWEADEYTEKHGGNTRSWVGECLLPGLSFKGYEIVKRTGDIRPEIVCLCGSTRFKSAFDEAYYRLTMQGRIVLSVGFAPNAKDGIHGESVGCTPEQKKQLDELYFRKIDLADRIFVLNVDGYIGPSTQKELDYARSMGKIIDYLETPK